jgi:hypothetical protein
MTYAAVLTREMVVRKKYLDQTPMKPSEYCNAWVTKITGIQPDERGYKKACVTELMRVTGCAESTVWGWGDSFDECPAYVKFILAPTHANNLIKEVFGYRADL